MARFWKGPRLYQPWALFRYRFTLTSCQGRFSRDEHLNISRYELLESLMSWSACFWAFFASSLEFTFGLSV